MIRRSSTSTGRRWPPRPKRSRRALFGAVAALLGLFGCSTAPKPTAGEHDLAAANFRLERRYKVEALRFKALDETWYDSPWFAPWISDEVKLILRDPERRVMSISRIFEDVDSGEHRSFSSRENCILPVRNASNDRLVAPAEAWSCSEAGVPGPFHFTVEMYEADTDAWSDLYDCLINLGCGFSVTLGYDSDSDDYTVGDELIGKATVVYTAEDLSASLPYVGDYAEETVTLGPCFDERGCVESQVGS